MKLKRIKYYDPNNKNMLLKVLHYDELALKNAENKKYNVSFPKSELFKFVKIVVLII